MIYIASALISLFITASLLSAALYLKALYYKVLSNTSEFTKVIINKGISRSLMSKEYANNVVKHIIMR